MSGASAYLDRIGRFELLTHEREAELARRVRAAREERDRAEPDAQVRRRGDRARSELLERNLRLVVSIARRYPTYPSVDLDDLIQAGNLGLAHAIELFDERRGFRFSTYATNWIRQSINRCIDKHASCVTIPIEKVQRVRAAQRGVWGGDDVPPDLVDARRAFASASLDAEDADGLSLSGVIPGSPAPSVEDAVLAEDERRWVVELVARLPVDQRRIVTMRFGLGGSRPMSLAAIGATINRRPASVSGALRDAVERLHAAARAGQAP